MKSSISSIFAYLVFRTHLVQIRVLDFLLESSAYQPFSLILQFELHGFRSNSSEEYISKMLASTLKSIIEESDNRIGRLVFKLAVELAMTMNIIAATHDIDELSLEKLRGECVKEVKKRNGNFSFDDAVKWQKG